MLVGFRLSLAMFIPTMPFSSPILNSFQALILKTSHWF